MSGLNYPPRSTWNLSGAGEIISQKWNTDRKSESWVSQLISVHLHLHPLNWVTFCGQISVLRSSLRELGSSTNTNFLQNFLQVLPCDIKKSYLGHSAPFIPILIIRINFNLPYSLHSFLANLGFVNKSTRRDENMDTEKLTALRTGFN